MAGREGGRARGRNQERERKEERKRGMEIDKGSKLMGEKVRETARGIGWVRKTKDARIR